MTVVYLIGGAVLVFLAGKQYGAKVEAEVTEVALEVFTKAKAKLLSVTQKALADVEAKEAVLQARVEKYL